MSPLCVSATYFSTPVVTLLFTLPVLLVHMCNVRLLSKPPFAVWAVQALQQYIGLYLFCQTHPCYHGCLEEDLCTVQPNTAI